MQHHINTDHDVADLQRGTVPLVDPLAWPALLVRARGGSPLVLHWRATHRPYRYTAHSSARAARRARVPHPCHGHPRGDRAHGRAGLWARCRKPEELGWGRSRLRHGGLRLDGCEQYCHHVRCRCVPTGKCTQTRAHTHRGTHTYICTGAKGEIRFALVLRTYMCPPPQTPFAAAQGHMTKYIMTGAPVWSRSVCLPEPRAKSRWVREIPL